MRSPSSSRATVTLALILWSPLLAATEPDRDFSGVWVLDDQHSELRNLPITPAARLHITQQETVIECAEADPQGNSTAVWILHTDGSPSKFPVHDSQMNSLTKWEGPALITSTIVTGPQNYSMTERWRLSRDHAVLTIRRQVQRPSGETESTLVYKIAAAKEVSSGKPPDATPAAGTSRPSANIVVPAGTRIPLSLLNSLNTKHASEGDRVYLQTSFPIVLEDRVIIPRGSYVTGTVTEVKRGGRLKGKSEIFLRFDSLTLPNGVTRDFRARLGGADADAGQVDRQEGKISGDGNKGGDARRVAETTAAGTAVGGIAGSAAGHAGMGVGVGAAAGAAAGLASVLLSRGPDVVLPKGTSFEMVLDRPVEYKPAELGR
jgi:type IV secretion system protein VirB10